MTNTVYYFEPETDACEQCLAMAGIYVETPPHPPHDYCDCKIIEYRMGEGEANCTVEYRHTSVREGNGSYEYKIDFESAAHSRIISVNTCPARYDIDPALRKSIESTGWHPKKTVEQLDFEIPASTQGSINCTCEFYDAIIYGDKYLIFTIGNSVYEKHIDSIEGEFHCIYAYSYTLNSTCSAKQ